MATYSFKLPDLGEGIVESEITAWHVAVGDEVTEDQHIADVMTDKAVVEVSSPVTGKVLSLGCEPGETVAVGSELVRFEVAGEALPKGSDEGVDTTRQAPDGSATPTRATRADSGGEPKDNTVSEPESSAEAAPESKARTRTAAGTGETPAPATTDDTLAPARHTGDSGSRRRVLASPSVRRRAREAGIDLPRVTGTGPDGRIGHRDIEAYLDKGAGGTVRTAQQVREGTHERPLSGLRRTIARRMEASKRNIPHYSYIEEIDVTQLEDLRRHLNAQRGEEQPKLTLLPFFAIALARALPAFPHCNAHFDEERDTVVEYEAVHLGIATMTDDGLVVPVLKHCESLDIWAIASEIARLSRGAREGGLRRDELGGSTISLTSLGAIGGIATTPIINAPETAIIGINRMQERPVVINGAVAIRRMMNLSSSFDHRIVDGYDGALLVQRLKELLENPGALFVE